MKRTSILAASLLAAVTALSPSAYAAADSDKAAEAKATDVKAVPEAKADKAVAKKKKKPHSHVEEKTGVAPTVTDSDPGKPNAAKDKSKHFHPRDAK